MTVAGPSGSTAPAARPPSPPLALIFSITVTGILANTLITPVVPDILADFGVGTGQAGVLVAAGTVPGIVMAPVIGLLADRHGRREVLVPCLVAFGVFGVASAFAPSFEVLLGLRLLQGVGSAGLINLAVVIIGDHWEGTERTRLIGRNSAVLTVSLAVFPPVGGLLSEIGGWRLSFAPYAVGLVTAAVLWRRLPRVVPTDPVALRRQIGDALVILRRREVSVTVVTGFVIFLLIFGLLLTVLPVHLEERFGLSAGMRGLVLAVPAVTSTVAALSLGRLRSRFGARALVLAASVTFVVAFAVIGEAPVLPVLVGGALLFGFGEGMVLPTLQDRAASAAPATSRGAVVAVWVGAARAGQSVGPLLAGLSLALIGSATTFVIGALLALGLLFWQRQATPAG
ncbi:MFS transporter [soil metagenome]